MIIKFQKYLKFMLIFGLILYSCGLIESEDDYEPVEKFKNEIHLFDVEKNTDMILGYGFSPQFSFDGQKIIFISADSSNEILKKIMIMDIDGQNKKTLVGAYQYLKDIYISPARPQLVFSAWDFVTQTSDLYLVNDDGTGLVNLTNSVDKQEIQPAFSEDGNYITYIQYAYNGYKYKLSLMDLNGFQKILRIADKNRLVRPQFTLNGTKIIYRDEVQRAGSQKMLRLIDIKNNDMDEALENIRITGLITYQGKLVYTEPYNHIKGYDLLTNIGVDIGSGLALAISADGEEIIFTENSMNVYYLKKMNYNGSSIKTVAVDSIRSGTYYYEYYPQFSKDKSKIVYEKKYPYYEY